MSHAQCPCCGYYTLSERGGYDICQVCWWEDDDESEVYGQPAPERPTGPNHVQLWETRENYLKFGASEERFKQYVRSPRQDELLAAKQDDA